MTLPESTTVDTLVSSISALFTDGVQNDPITLYLNSVSPTVNPAAIQPGQNQELIGSGVGFYANSTHELLSLNTQALFDFERFTSFRLYLTGKDWPSRNNPPRNFVSKRAEGQFDVTIQDVNEPPLFPGGGTIAVQVLENTAAGGLVGQVVAKDPDSNTVLSFSLTTSVGHSASDVAPFAVSNAGTVATDLQNNVARIVVSGTGTTALDYESGKTSFTFDVVASDNGGGTARTTVTVTVKDAPEPPVLGNAVTTVLENEGTWSYCLPFMDPDGAAGNTFVIEESELSSFVTVVSPGCVQGVGKGFDYENQDYFVVTVNVTDDGNPSFTDTGTLAIHVRNVMDMSITSIVPSSLPTYGGTVMLNGTNIGPSDLKWNAMSTTTDQTKAQRLKLTYTNPTSGLTVSYAATDCAMVASGTCVSCTIPPGVGSGFTWLLQVGEDVEVAGQNNQTLEFSIGFKYASPVITGVWVNHIKLDTNANTTNVPTLSTAGNTTIKIVGSSLGPLGVQTSAIEVKYAKGLSTMDLRTNPSNGYVAQDCAVTTAHTAITCSSVAGVGEALEFWVSNLAGSYSNVLPTYIARYQVPILDSVKPSSSSQNTTRLSTSGGTVLVLIGRHFGPVSASTSVFATAERSSVTFGGPTGLGYSLTECRVIVEDTFLECTTPPGTGYNHHYLLTRGDQTTVAVSSFTTSYAPPTLNSVSGQSLSSADTQGGLRVTVLGGQLGNTVRHALTHSINVYIKYGDIAEPHSTWYSCTEVEMVSPSNGVSCVMAPGTGSGHAMVVHVDGQQSNVLENAISYSPPVLLSFNGPGANAANTTGGELVIIQGRNFGPAGSSKIDAVRYGRAVDTPQDWLHAESCNVVESHFQIHCRTGVGGGNDLRWLVTIDRQNSTSPTTSYANPSLHSVEALTTGAPVTNGDANGNEQILLLGSNFGPVGDRLVDQVTFGPHGNQYQLKECTVTRLSREITCTTPPGIGQNLRFFVYIAGQRSTTAATATFSYASPVIVKTSETTVDTVGQSIELIGTNFGLQVPGIGIRVSFGSTILRPLTTSQLLGQDTIRVTIPPLTTSFSPSTNISTLLELTSGSTVLTSLPVSISYNPPYVSNVRFCCVFFLFFFCGASCFWFLVHRVLCTEFLWCRFCVSLMIDVPFW